jgi:multimeric flavodoxin WrbA
MLNSDIIIVGTPNYCDNVSGLFKDFIDRTNPFYETDLLKGKKLINIVVGGGSKENTQRVIDGALKSFGEMHQLDIIGNFVFQGLNIGDVLNDKEFNKNINDIIEKVKNG